jgi:PAS domain S-box-containing protein
MTAAVVLQGTPLFRLVRTSPRDKSRTALKDSDRLSYSGEKRPMDSPRRSDESWGREGDWRTFVDAIEDYAIFLLDAQGHIATWNRGAEKIKGYAPREIIGKHFSVFYGAEDLASDKPGRELAVARETGTAHDEGWRLRKDGTRFWANVVITALRDQRGELRGFVKVTKDLTIDVAAAEALRRSEERFRLLVEAVSDYAIYMLDPTGKVSTWNAGAEKLKGYRADEILGHDFSVFFPEDDIRQGKPVRELALARETGRFEEEGYRLRKDGTRFWANVVLTPVRDASGTLIGFAKVTRDLTARIESERTARELAREHAARTAAEAAEIRVRAAAQLAAEAAKRAEEANRAKDEFLATVSHELRTPLNAIVGWASLLRTRSSDPALEKGLDIIHRNALSQSKIVDDIIDVSRIVTGKLRLELGQVELSAVVDDAIEVIAPSAAAKGIVLEFARPTQPCILFADADRLQQVAWNLLSNAVKFADRGGTIWIEIDSDGTTASLTVRDNGRGIEPEFLPFVFDRFKQADSSSTRRVGGLGLGLAIVRHLVELHGGQVDAASPGLGHGATFRITLPIRADQPASKAPASLVPPPRAPVVQQAAAIHSRLSGTRVLVVDDEDDARDLLLTALTQAGAEVVTANSAQGGFDLVRQFRPHVLVSDIGMPGEDGYSFIQRVRALGDAAGGNVPAIALTAYTRGTDRARALSVGFDTHIGKPVDPGELVQTVEQLVGPKR